MTISTKSDMAEDSNFNSEIETKIEAELFSLIRSILNLNNKFQKGKINDNFFKKALKNTMNKLFKFKLILKEKNIYLIDLLEKMQLSEEFNEVIDLITRVSSLNLSNEKKENHNINILDLPGLTSEITASFITLMDALTLKDFKNQDFIIRLFDELNNGLSNFPGVEDLVIKFEDIQRKFSNDLDKLLYEPKLKEKVVDDLYMIFKEFQNKLDLNP